MIWPDLCYYQGNFNNNKIEGEGIYTNHLGKEVVGIVILVLHNFTSSIKNI